MGDRVLMQCYNSKTNEFGPVAYGHWSGDRALAVADALATRMVTRPGDLAYASARMVQALVRDATGNTGFGLWNTDHLLTAYDSHGDAGCIILDVANRLKPTFMGGYYDHAADTRRLARA